MNNCMLERLTDIRDNIDIMWTQSIVVDPHPTNEYEILDRISDKLTDIILILKKEGGV